MMNTYRRHRCPPDIISCAFWLYYRFNLSYLGAVSYGCAASASVKVLISTSSTRSTATGDCSSSIWTGPTCSRQKLCRLPGIRTRSTARVVSEVVLTTTVTGSSTIPCIFPGKQGNLDGDGFAADCKHRQIIKSPP